MINTVDFLERLTVLFFLSYCCVKNFWVDSVLAAADSDQNNLFEESNNLKGTVFAGV